MSENPFDERTEWKKRVITVSVTKEQADAVATLQERLDLPSTSAVIKYALRHLIDGLPPRTLEVEQ